GYDQLRVVNGQVDLRGCKLQTGLKAGFVPVLGDQFTIIQTSQPVLGTFDGLPEGAVVQLNGLAFQITYQGGAGHDVVLTRGVRVGVALQASVTALQVGQPLTLTATVTGPTGAAAPTGMVTFLDGTTSLGSAGLDGN